MTSLDIFQLLLELIYGSFKLRFVGFLQLRWDLQGIFGQVLLELLDQEVDIIFQVRILICKLSLKGVMQLKFTTEEEERLEVWKLSLESLDLILDLVLLFFKSKNLRYILRLYKFVYSVFNVIHFI